MKKFTVTFVAALSLSVFGLTGCGGSGENTVVESAEQTEMSPQQQTDYEEYMKKQQQRPGN